MSDWKETELGTIPQHWKIIPADKYCLRVTDGTHDSPKQQKEGKHLITSKHIKNKEIDFETAYFISEYDYNEINRRSRVDQWDLIISMIGEYCGFVYLETNKQINYAVKNVGLFKVGDEVNARWLYYYFISDIAKHQIRISKMGTSQPYLTLSSLRGFPILDTPVKKEKETTVSILSSLDNKIDLLRRQNQTLEQLAQTIFKQWFVDCDNADWDTAKLSDYAFINQRTVDKNYPYQVIEYLDTGSITEGVIKGFQMSSLNDAPSRAQRLVQQNDIVYSLVRPIQKHYGLLKEVKPNTVVSTGFAVITCNGIDPHFIYLLLTQDRQTEYFEIVANNSTSTYPSLKPSDIANLEFKVPQKDLLNKFAGFASSTWNKISLNQKEIQTLTQLRDILLPRLMSGRLRVG